MDPDDQPEDWLVHGAPAGLFRHILDRGIFPVYDPEVDVAEGDAQSLVTESEFCNYTGVEDNPLVADEIDRMRDKGYATEYSTLSEAEAAVGGQIVLSRIGAIERIKNGKIRMRIVIDSKKSGVSRSTRKYERSCLPQALHVVWDTLELLGDYWIFLSAIIPTRSL